MSKDSMSDKITRSLRWEITNGGYSDATILTEIEISQKYEVSKTPAREALGVLCAEGLLEKLPRKGYLIKKFSMADTVSLLQFRGVLETQGIEISKNMITRDNIEELRAFCAECNALSPEEASALYVDMNRKFHVMLISFSRNPFMTAALANTMDRLRLALTTDQKINAPKFREHDEIVSALERSDYELVKTLLSNASIKVCKRLAACEEDSFSMLHYGASILE